MRIRRSVVRSLLALVLSPAKLPKYIIDNRVPLHILAPVRRPHAFGPHGAFIRLEIATLTLCRTISRSGAGDPAKKTKCHRQIHCLQLQRNLHICYSLGLQTKVVCRGSALPRSSWGCPQYQPTRDKEPRHSKTFQTQPLESYIRSFGALPINWTNHSGATIGVSGSLPALAEWDNVTASQTVHDIDIATTDTSVEVSPRRDTPLQPAEQDFP